MLPTEDLFVYVYVLIDGVRSRPGPSSSRRGPGLCSAAPTRRSWRSPRCACCWAAAARPGSSPRWPATGRTCSRYCRTKASSTGGPVGCGARLSSSARCWRPACPKTTASRSTLARCRSSTPPGSAAPTAGKGFNGLHARFGRDAAHAEWFYGFRLAAKTDLGSRIVRAWSIVPAAVSERDVGTDLLEAGPPPRDLLADKGFNGKAFAASAGRLRHRRAGPAHQGPAQDHAGDPAEGHRPVAQPHRDHL